MNGEGVLERVEALVRMGAPPGGFPEVLPILPGQVLAMTERREGLVRGLPCVIREGLASTVTELGIDHLSPG
jgi:hypothetical protein